MREAFHRELDVLGDGLVDLTQLVESVLDDRWHLGVPRAVGVTLLGRSYERYADHAVSVASGVVYLGTGAHTDTHALSELEGPR